MKFWVLALSSLLSWTINVSAGPLGFCGQFDLRTMANEDLVNLLILKDPKVTRQQCGLFPGENLPICSACDSGDGEELMDIIRPILRQDSHRYWHSNWHKVRAHEEIDEAYLATLKKRGITPELWTMLDMRPHLAFGKLAGEDFLYMHRLMLKMVQLELAFAGKPCLAPWRDLPAPSYSAPSSKLTLYQKQLEALRRPEFLRSVKSLNRLGAIIEPIFHKNLHEYYSSPERCSAESIKEDTCDDLVPVETSPFNRHFWKIHGLVDSIVGTWLKEHEYLEISTNCGDRPHCYPWRGTWVGAYPVNAR